MKLTENKLRNIIREELDRISDEYVEKKPDFYLGGEEYSTVSGLRLIFDKMPELQKYRNPDARYDDVHYEIPVRKFKQITGLSDQEMKMLQTFSHRQYAGSLMVNNGVVEIIGAA